MTSRSACGLVLVAMLFTAGVASAETGESGFLNAEVRIVSAGSSVSEQVAQLRETTDDAQWVAWQVPAVDPQEFRCCYGNGFGRTEPGTCKLESRNHFSGQRDGEVLRGGDLRVLLRLADGAVDKVHTYSSACPLDAGGRTVTVLDGVRPEASVRLLESIVTGDRGRKTHDETVMAIAGHAGPAADDVLARFAHRDSPRGLRGKTAFWLGAERGERGLTLLRTMLRQERDGDVLDKVVFGISLSKGTGAAELLVDAARNDERSEVRKKALFWLAQRAGQRVVETLGEAVRDDPDAEVREHAVFALSQLSGGRGIPRLLELARNNRHPEVREKAMFWLGQSGDPRALDLFEEILAR